MYFLDYPNRMYFPRSGNLEKDGVKRLYSIVKSNERSPVLSLLLSGFSVPKAPKESLFGNLDVLNCIR
jgi:hypothetical protein